MGEVVRQVPVDAVLHVPLFFLGEFLAHEQQLLTGEGELPGVQGFELAHPVLLFARRFLHHGALAVHHLVVAQHQDKVFRESVIRDVGQLAVVIFAVDGIQVHVPDGIVHPAHVPLEGKTQAALLYVRGDAPFGGGILGDEEAGGLATDLIIELAQEVHAFQIHAAAEPVGPPLGAVIVVVEHGCHRVHPQGVHVEFLDPVHGVGDQEGANLRLAVVKGQGAPDGELPAQGVAVFIEGRAVEPAHGKGVLGEVGRHPVQDYADPRPVQGVHEGAEIIGRAVAAGGGVESRHLIAPGQVEGMLADAHQFHVGIAHVGDVIHQVVRKLGIIQEAVLVLRAPITLLPGAQMHFINGHGAFQHLGVVPLGLMGIVRPLEVVKAPHDGGVVGPLLKPEAVGVALIALHPIRPGDHIAVGVALAHVC